MFQWLSSENSFDIINGLAGLRIRVCCLSPTEARKQAQEKGKQHCEDIRICHKGVTYEAGAFGELEPCNEPNRKKKAK